MTTKIAGPSSSAVAVETEAHEPAATAPPPTSKEANSIAQWSSSASEEAFADIEWDYRNGWFPDMESIDADLAKLGGIDLLQTMKKLDEAGHLDGIINRMSPDERYAFVGHALNERLLSNYKGHLGATYDVPMPFLRLLADMNGLAADRASSLTYNWSGYREDPIDFSDRKAAWAVPTMKPGDSLTLSSNVGVYGALLSAGASHDVAVSRDPDGAFRVSAEVGVEAGLLKHLHVGGRVEAGGGVAGRVEYRFQSAEEAQAAVLTFRSSSAKGLDTYGRPTAFELKDKATIDAMLFIGREHMKVAKLSTGEEAQLAVRFEMHGDQPTVSLKVEGKLHGQAGAMLEWGPIEAEAHALPGAEAGRRVEAEVKAPIRDPKAFSEAPAKYLREHGAEMMREAELNATISSEELVGHHATVDEISITKRDGATEVERSRKHFTVEHGGFEWRQDLVPKAAGFEVGYGSERRSVEKEETLYKRRVN